MNNNHTPLVSIVTPAYNQGIFLRETIESVLSQDYPNIELIVLNDGSTDDTEAILKDYSGRIYWETQKNMGQTATINKGWKLSKGEIITWLNSDDTLLPGGVSTGVKYLLDHPDTDIVFGDTLMTDAEGNPLYTSPPQPPFDYKHFLVNCNNTISQPSTFIKRKVLDQAGYLDEKYYYFMDWDFWMRAGLNAKMVHIKDVMSTYRLHAESKTVAQALKAAPELEYMYKKYFSRNDLPEWVLSNKKKAMMNMYFMMAGYYLKGGDLASARRSANNAITSNPSGIFSANALHKYIYCRWGNSALYNGLRTLTGRKSVIK